MARPKIEFDERGWEQIQDMCRIHCTGEEIAAIMDCCYDTLNTRCKEKYGIGFSEYYKKHASGGKKSLRRHQMDAAENGNTTMLIWLGKQYLGQSDQAVQEIRNVDRKSPFDDNK